MTASYEGRAFGRFHVLARVGAGGMGEVYRARDEHLQRDVAIKFLKQGTADDRRTMRREAHALSQLNHPNIATVHDLLHEDGVDFVVMELIEGRSIDELLESGPMAPDTVVEVARQIAAGLGEAHEHGIVHRDLKPGNVMMTARGQVKLVDFGLATQSGSLEAEAGALTDRGDLGRRIGSFQTSSGALTGTLPYMAPEQIAGRPADARTDIWAFGAVIYQMVTKHRPFSATNALMLADAILNREPPAPSSLVPGVPAWLEEVTLKALEKAPERRFQSVAELQQALERGIASSVAAAAPEVATPTRRPLIFAAVALLLVAAGVVGWSTWHRRPANPPQRLSVLLGDTVNRTGDATFDATVTELLAVSLEQSRFLTLYPRPRASFVLQLMHKAADTPIDQASGLEICQREGLSALLTSSVAKLGDAYLLLLTLQDPGGRLVSTARQQFAVPSDLPARIDAAVREIRADLGESAASIRGSSAPLAEVTSGSLEAVRFYTQGKQQMYAGDPKAAIVMFEKALELDPEFAMALEGIGVAYTNMVDLAQAEQYVGRAAKLVDSVPEAERHKILGDYNMLTRNYEEACPHLEVLTQLRPLDPTSFIALGICKSFRFDNAGAIRETQHALEMQPTFRSRMNLARYQLLAGDAARSLAAADALRREAPLSLQGYYIGGQAELILGKLADARRNYQTMVGLGDAAEVEGHLGLADLDLATGRVGEARAELERGWQAAHRNGNVLRAAGAATALAELALAEGEAADLDVQLARLRGSGNAVVDYLQGRTLARAGRVEEAVSLIRAADAAPAADRALAAMLRAEVALARGDAAGAMKEADAAWNFEPSVLARETQARAYAAGGRRAEAAGFYADVLARAGQRIDFYDGPGFHRVMDVELRLGALLDDLGERAQARPHLEKVVATLAGAGEDSPLYVEARRRLGG